MSNLLPVGVLISKMFKDPQEIIYLEIDFLAPQDSITGDKIYIKDFLCIFKIEKLTF